MPRRPKSVRRRPIPPPRYLERRYYRGVYDAILTPLFNRTRGRLAQAGGDLASLNLAFVLTDDEIGAMGDLARYHAVKHLVAVDAHHLKRTLGTLQNAFKKLQIDIKPYLQSAHIRPLIFEAIERNVDLIKSVPPRYMDDLRAGIHKTFEAKPFDQDALQKVVREKGRSAGYNLRRITRDQTSKVNGQLTQIRHSQLRIQRYYWLTSADGRVRQSHRDLHDTIQQWDFPPAIGHPGSEILCRCTAAPFIEPEVYRPSTWPGKG